MDKIQAGDTVKVFFSTHPPIIGKVLYTPQATGDAFHIKESQCGDLIYVQQYDYMWRISND